MSSKDDENSPRGVETFRFELPPGKKLKTGKKCGKSDNDNDDDDAIEDAGENGGDDTDNNQPSNVAADNDVEDEEYESDYEYEYDDGDSVRDHDDNDNSVHDGNDDNGDSTCERVLRRWSFPCNSSAEEEGPYCGAALDEDGTMSYEEIEDYSYRSTDSSEDGFASIHPFVLQEPDAENVVDDLSERQCGTWTCLAVCCVIGGFAARVRLPTTVIIAEYLYAMTASNRDVHIGSIGGAGVRAVTKTAKKIIVP